MLDNSFLCFCGLARHFDPGQQSDSLRSFLSPIFNFIILFIASSTTLTFSTCLLLIFSTEPLCSLGLLALAKSICDGFLCLWAVLLNFSGMESRGYQLLSVALSWVDLSSPFPKLNSLSSSALGWLFRDSTLHTFWLMLSWHWVSKVGMALLLLAFWWVWTMYCNYSAGLEMKLAEWVRRCPILLCFRLTAIIFNIIFYCHPTHFPYRLRNSSKGSRRWGWMGVDGGEWGGWG